MFINPVKSSDAKITSTFGLRTNPVTNEYTMHNGLDIGAILDTPVYAVADASVYDTGYDNLNGNYIKYKIDNQYQVVFAHLNKVFVKNNEEIKQGMEIATMGNTGNSTGIHLHYTIYKDGVPIDPMPYVDLPHSSSIYLEYARRGEEVPYEFKN